MQYSCGFGSVYIAEIRGIKITIFAFRDSRTLIRHIRFLKLNKNLPKLQDKEEDISVDTV